MWQAWDLAVDICLSQFPAMLANPNLEFKVFIPVNYILSTHI